MSYLNINIFTLARWEENSLLQFYVTLFHFTFQEEKSLLETSERSCRQQLKQADETIQVLNDRAKSVNEKDRQLYEKELQLREKDRQLIEMRSKMIEMAEMLKAHEVSSSSQTQTQSQGIESQN